MSEVDFERVRAVFLAARDLDHSARDEALRGACAGDAALRSEVESLLSHHDASHDRLTTPVVELLARSSHEIEERLPRPFGAFELQEVIGRGGMGAVYRARQRSPDRTVAVKVIRPGMMSRTMLGRFRYEADVLARLQHPGIAQIFETGTVAKDGESQPYFAMELVSGQPIDRYSIEQGLTVHRRVEMLIRVCEAVHHAHQKGVIHRDLKPANILVDATGQPKILDFGIARMTEADIRTTSLQTGAGQLVGTLPYMSPEQVSGDPSRLDIRSDVYALGVLAFELLTGRLPLDLRDKSLADAALAIRDGAPARLGAVAPDLRGDLETITAKTLEKEPARRYASAAALAEDLRRFLAHQPLVARPPSVRYQVRLFARRHRALVVGGIGGLAALVLATGVSVGFAIDARRSASRESYQRQIAERTSAYLTSILGSSDPHRRGVELKVTEALDLTVARLDGEPELPEVEANVRLAIGKTYLGQQRFVPAIVQLARAADLLRAIAPIAPDLADALVQLANAQGMAGAGDGGELAYREAIAIQEELGAPRLNDTRAQLAHVLIRQRKFAEAEPIVEQRLAAARRENDPVLTIAALRQLARIRSDLGAHEAAIESTVEAYDLARRHLPETHPMHSNLLTDLAKVRHAKGDYEPAIEASRRAYELVQRTRKPGAFDWLIGVETHVEMLGALDRREEIATVLTGAVGALTTTIGADDPETVRMKEALAHHYERWGQPEKARELLGADAGGSG